MSILIEGGRIITGSDDYVADVYIDDESVTLIGVSLDVSADRVIDARGKYVLPGCIDPHTHFDMPFGGTTTHIDFANQVRGHSRRRSSHRPFVTSETSRSSGTQCAPTGCRRSPPTTAPSA